MLHLDVVLDDFGVGREGAAVDAAGYVFGDVGAEEVLGLEGPIAPFAREGKILQRRKVPDKAAMAVRPRLVRSGGEMAIIDAVSFGQSGPHVDGALEFFGPNCRFHRGTAGERVR